MCTLTAHRLGLPDRSALWLAMNRDESRTRAAKIPPAITEPPGAPRVLAPRDGAAGGTWIGVNDRGLIAALLNLYPDGIAPEAPRATVTRGALVDRALTAATVDEACAAIAAEVRVGRYSPFRLALVSLDGGRLITWTGFDVVREDALEDPHDRAWVFLTSSSWRSPEVLPWREEKFRAWREAGAEHIGPVPSFHLWQPEGREEWAPLVAREKSVTRSLTKIEIDRTRGEAAMAYWRDPTAAGGAPSAIVELGLRG